jgi:hypothetical protein
MERRKKTVDHTLKERHGILHLLKQVEKEGVTFDELDEIGQSLKRAGRRALSPLVRRLWRETDGELLSRYAYLLDFFESESWLDQLIQIVLRRIDLDNEAKSALLGALHDYGVDIGTPPFARLLDNVRGPLSETLPRLLERGEEGLILFMEDFLQSPQEMQIALVQELAQLQGPQILELLELLLGLDTPEVVTEVVVTLGKVREQGAADILKRCAAEGDRSLREPCQRSLRRLAFVGIHPAPSAARPQSLPFHVCWASPLDGAGYRTLWFARWREQGQISFICLHIHESSGVRAAWGSGIVSLTEFDEISRERGAEEGLLRIPLPYALKLLRDALHHNREAFFQLPPEFYVLKKIFAGENLAPTPYIPEFPGYDLKSLSHAPQLVMAGASLLDDDLFAGWYMATCRVYDLAEEWLSLENKAEGKTLAKGLEGILERFCRELIAPIIEQLRNRLLLTADLLQRTGSERTLVEISLATAFSITNFTMPYHLHPFLRRLALESMDAAREALAEGYDLREHPHEADDDEWWD